MVTGNDDSIEVENNNESIGPTVNNQATNVSNKILIKGRKMKRLTKKLNELDESDEEFFNSSDDKKKSKSNQQSENSSVKSSDDNNKTFGLKFHNKLLNTGKILSHWNDNPQKIIVDMKLMERTNKIIQKIATVGLDNPINNANDNETNFESKPLERWSSNIHPEHEIDKTNPIIEEKLARIQQVETQIARSESTKNDETIFYDKENCPVSNDMEKSKEFFDKTLSINDTAQVLKNFSSITNSWLSGLSSATKLVGEATKTAASTTMNHAAKHLVNAQNIISTNASAVVDLSLPVGKNLQKVFESEDNQISNAEQDSFVTDDWINNDDDDWDDPIVLNNKSEPVLNETKKFKRISPIISNSIKSLEKEVSLDEQSTKMTESDCTEKIDSKANDDGWDDWDDDVETNEENVESSLDDLKSSNVEDKTLNLIIEEFPKESVQAMDEQNDWDDNEIDIQITDEQLDSPEMEQKSENEDNDVNQTTLEESPSHQQNNDELTESELEERRKAVFPGIGRIYDDDGVQILCTCPAYYPPPENVDDNEDEIVNGWDDQDDNEIELQIPDEQPNLPEMVENDVEQTTPEESPSDQQNNDELTEAELEERRKAIFPGIGRIYDDNGVQILCICPAYHPPPTDTVNENDDEIVDGWDDWEDKDIDVPDEQSDPTEIEPKPEEIEQPIEDAIHLNNVNDTLLIEENESNNQETDLNDNKKQESPIPSSFDIEKPFSDEKISTNSDSQLEFENFECNIPAEPMSDSDEIKDENIQTVIKNFNVLSSAPLPEKIDIQICDEQPDLPEMEENDVEQTTTEKSPSDQQNVDHELRISDEDFIMNCNQEEKNDWCDENIDIQNEMKIDNDDDDEVINEDLQSNMIENHVENNHDVKSINSNDGETNFVDCSQSDQFDSSTVQLESIQTSFNEPEKIDSAVLILPHSTESPEHKIVKKSDPIFDDEQDGWNESPQHKISDPVFDDKQDGWDDWEEEPEKPQFDHNKSLKSEEKMKTSGVEFESVSNIEQENSENLEDIEKSKLNSIVNNKESTTTKAKSEKSQPKFKEITDNNDDWNDWTEKDSKIVETKPLLKTDSKINRLLSKNKPKFNIVDRFDSDSKDQQNKTKPKFAKIVDDDNDWNEQDWTESSSNTKKTSSVTIKSVTNKSSQHSSMATAMMAPASISSKQYQQLYNQVQSSNSHYSNNSSQQSLPPTSSGGDFRSALKTAAVSTMSHAVRNWSFNPVSIFDSVVDNLSNVVGVPSAEEMATMMRKQNQQQQPKKN
ncbi:hypothetical protein DERP_003614 [Dermatophagoides pteronyssinus]|uniref:Protein PFC0760c-like n=1 Tax=Dermatophagoides pteronyssinus TaxID=6956 RepID=A0ABQ8JL48_DERPT|nr:hypothetical protein DERP_003614 [Dermatophagoides pteronyssinus]